MHGLSSLIDLTAAGTLGRDSHRLSPCGGDCERKMAGISLEQVGLRLLTRLARDSERGSRGSESCGPSQPIRRAFSTPSRYVLDQILPRNQRRGSPDDRVGWSTKSATYM